MEKFLYPTHPVVFIKIRKFLFSTNLTLNNINDFRKIYIFYKDICQNFLNVLVLSNQISKFPNILTEEDLHQKIDEIVIHNTLKNLKQRKKLLIQKNVWKIHSIICQVFHLLKF